VAARRQDDHSPGGQFADDPPGRLRGADAFRLHLTLVLGLALCISAFIFEVFRALGGNTLSWAYVFEWPIFAGFAIYMWWNLLHGSDGSSRSRKLATRAPSTDQVPEQPVRPAVDDDKDEDLAAWEAYLRSMEADEARQSQSEAEAEQSPDI
jgi:hypothetical protein